MKKVFTGKDASILALFAQSSYCQCSEGEVSSLLGDLSCPEARHLGQAILDKDLTNPEVKAYFDWADSLWKPLR